MIKIRNYTQEELEFIKDNYNTMTAKEIAVKLNKSLGSINNATRKMGLIKQVHNQWTDEEIAFLKKNYVNMTSEEIATHINHTVDAINTMRDRLKLVRSQGWTDAEIQYLKDNYETTLFSELSEKLGRTEGAIRAKCFDLNLCIKDPWTEEEIQFVKDNYMEMPTADIARILNRTRDAIQLRARRLGLKKYPYTCDYHYFDEIDTEEKAYWLGFLTADGWININKKSNAGVTGLELQYGDIGHLKKFNKSIGGNYQITDRWRTCLLSPHKDQKSHLCCIRIFSLTMYQSLVNQGFTNNKSFDAHIPVIRDDLLRHYFRGYFDGDGCFTFTNRTFNIQFITASPNLLNDIKQIMCIHKWHYNLSPYTSDFNTEIYGLNISRNKEKLQFLDWIYQDSNIYLDRKYQKYLKVKKHFNQFCPAA